MIPIVHPAHSYPLGIDYEQIKRVNRDNRIPTLDRSLFGAHGDDFRRIKKRNYQIGERRTEAGTYSVSACVFGRTKDVSISVRSRPDETLVASVPTALGGH